MTKQVLFIAHHGFSLTTLATVSDAFFVANWQSGQDLYRWDICSAATQNRHNSQSSFSDIQLATRPLSEFNPKSVDIVVALSSFEPFGLADAPGVSGFLRAAHRFGARIVGLETGGVALARAGLLAGSLEGRDVAVHWANRDGFSEAFPDVTLSDAALVRDGRCLTSAGGVAALDLALSLIEEDAGAALARTVATHLLRPAVSGASASGTSAGAGAGKMNDPMVRAAQRLMEETLDEPIDIVTLATRLGTTQRTLQRHFTQALGRSPQAHYLALRLTRAQNLLQQTTLPVGDIAADTGFDSLPSFSRAYKDRFGISPRHDRAQTTTASVPRVY